MAYSGQENWVAVITGGYGGLGRACVDHFARLGTQVIAVDIQKIQDISPELSSKVESFVADVSDEKAVQAVTDHVKQKYGRVDILINCAGIAAGGATYDFTKNEPHSLEMFNKVIQVNTVGTFNPIRLIVPLMASNQPDSDGQRGIIINVASVVGIEANPRMAAYAASKAAVAGMTLPLAREFGHLGIRVVAIAPGFSDTPMLKALPASGQLLKALAVFPKRMVKPEEFAHLCQSIVDNHAINAEVIRLDGGVRISMPQGYSGSLPAKEVV